MSAKKSSLARKDQPFKQLTLNFASSPKAASSVASSPQLNKDGFAQQCKVCHMFYNPHERQDAQMHTKYHNEFTHSSLLKYSSSGPSTANSKRRVGAKKNEKLVQQYVDGKCVVIENGVDSNQAVSKALAMLDYVDQQLGIKELDKSVSGRVSKMLFKNEPLKVSKDLKLDSRKAASYKFYLFVCSMTNRIVGFCLAEQIDKAFEIQPLSATREAGTFSYDESKPFEAVCGISRIWVAEPMRRKHVASRLLDCVRMNFLYIYTLAKNQLAFSDPTQLGQTLARAYLGDERFLVYNSSTSVQIRANLEVHHGLTLPSGDQENAENEFVNEFSSSDEA